MDQRATPLADALLKQAQAGYVPFDVPGHKGNIRELADYFGMQCLLLDKNSRRSIDNLCQPTGVIRQAEALAAEAFGAKDACFMVGGTTSSVQAMILSAVSQGDKIILPRNVHASVINAVILAGAIPVYVNPSIHDTLGISLGMRIEDVRQSILYNTDAKAVLFNNPTYYGICSNIGEIIRLAHAYGMLALADEAHGTHFSFHGELPAAAIHSGADMSSVSMHKTGGSLTQSSMLLMGENVDTGHVRSVVNLTRTTSASYLLLSSLDIARKKLATEGARILDHVIESAAQARARINAIGGYYAFGADIIDGDAIYDFDATKLCVNTAGVGLAGIEVYTLLRDRHRVQIEFGDVGNILALLAIGDSDEYTQALTDALASVKHTKNARGPAPFRYEYISPVIKMSPNKAFYAPKRRLRLEDSIHCVSGDYIMCYPPGIPLLAPGELITEEIVAHIRFAAQKGCAITGMASADANEIQIVNV